MKEIIAKIHQHNKSKLTGKFFVRKKCITLETEIAKKLNEFFTKIGLSLARKIPTPSNPWEVF